MDVNCRGQDVHLRAKGCTAGETERYYEDRRQKTEATEISVERRKGDHARTFGVRGKVTLGVPTARNANRERNREKNQKSWASPSERVENPNRAEASNGKRKTQAGQDQHALE
jgi:hypothetical protein